MLDVLIYKPSDASIFHFYKGFKNRIGDIHQKRTNSWTY